MKSIKDPHNVDHPYINDVLIYDLETDGLNTETANIKFFGAYSYKYNKYFLVHGDETNNIRRLLDEHRVHVGFNNSSFDKPILQNNGYYDEATYKSEVDCLKVLYDFERKKPNRESLIKLRDGRTLAAALPNRKLGTIAEVLGFDTLKGDIDYRIFQKNAWSPIELKQIYKYLYKDVHITRQLFEYYLNYFEGLRGLVPEENARKFQYIKSSSGSLAYSIICNLAGLKVEWESDAVHEGPENHGGFVLAPQVEYAEGIVVYGDFSSLYPNIMFMCNVFSPSPDGWDGTPLVQSQLNGRYNTKEQGVIEKTLRDIYKTRARLKKEKSLSELGYKIVLNSVYGISGSPIFKNIYNPTTAPDITMIGRRMINLIRERFEEEGMRVIYGDTDSCFIHLSSSQTIDDFKRVAKMVTDEILSMVPFPSPETFKFEVDATFKKLWLFGKKNYAGFTVDGKLKITGLPVIKHDASRLGKEILSRLEGPMLAQQTIKFSRKIIMKVIDELIHQDVTWVSRTYNVRKPEAYSNDSSIQAQVAFVHGEGSHVLVPNSKIGAVGKSKKYCTVEEASVLSVDDIDLSKTLNELAPFMEDDVL